MPQQTPRYEPSPEEIAQLCEEIQRAWSEAERDRHAESSYLPQRWQVPQIRTAEIGEVSQHSGATREIR